MDNEKFDKAVAVNYNNVIGISWEHFYRMLGHFLGGNDNGSDQMMKTMPPTIKRDIIFSRLITKKLNERPSFFKISGKTYWTHPPTFVNKYDNVFKSRVGHTSSTHPALADNHSTIVKRMARNACSIHPTSQITPLKYKANKLKMVARHHLGYPVYVINNKLKKMVKNASSAYPTLINKYTVLKIIAKNASSTGSTTSVHNITLKRIARKDNNSTLYAHVHNNILKRVSRSSNLSDSTMISNNINATQRSTQTVASTASTKAIIQNRTEKSVKVPKSSNIVEQSSHFTVDGCCISGIFVLLSISMSKCNYYYYFSETFNRIIRRRV